MLDAERRLEVSVQRARGGASLTCIVVYDEVLGHIDDLTIHAQYLLGKLLSERTVVDAIYHLRVVKEWLIALSKTTVKGEADKIKIFDPKAITDDALLKLRGALLKQLHARPGRSKLAAKRTVNRILFCTYRWLWWLRNTGRADDFLIGEFPCRVLSEAVRKPEGNAARRTSDGARFTTPLCLTKVSSGPRYKVPGFVPDDEARLDMMDFFDTTTAYPYIAARNKLILNLANVSGMRRGSINSLEVRQFSRHEITESGDYFSVVPPLQKLNYEDWYDIPQWLALQVCDFIEGERRQLLEERDWSGHTVDRIFISHTTGQALEDRSITHIFRKAMRATGAPPGAAVQAWRHKHTADFTDDEIDYRIEAGLDTSEASIRAAISFELHHKSPDSLAPYVASRLSRRRRGKGASGA